VWTREAQASCGSPSVRRWRASRLWSPVALVMLGLMACGGGDRSTPNPERAADDTAITTSPAPGGPLGADVVRTCRTSGKGGLSAQSYADSLVVGPIALGSLGNVPDDVLPRRPAQASSFPAVESIAVLRAGSSVTVAIPSRERAFVGFIYDERKFRGDGLYRIDDLDHVVRFDACRDRRFNGGVSQFDGGIVVDGPRCVSLDFYVGSSPRALRRRIGIDTRCT
jgi:hypothetical protein